MRQSNLTLVIKNNTASVIPFALFAKGFTSVNARTAYIYDLIGESFSANKNQISILVRKLGADEFEFFKAPLLDRSVAGVAAALNSLGLASWIVVGTTVVGYSDALEFGDLDIYSVGQSLIGYGGDLVPTTFVIKVNGVVRVNSPENQDGELAVKPGDVIEVSGTSPEESILPSYIRNGGEGVAESVPPGTSFIDTFTVENGVDYFLTFATGDR
jgi:hypothetical protein